MGTRWLADELMRAGGWRHGSVTLGPALAGALLLELALAGNVDITPDRVRPIALGGPIDPLAAQAMRLIAATSPPVPVRAWIDRLAPGLCERVRARAATRAPGDAGGALRAVAALLCASQGPAAGRAYAAGFPAAACAGERAIEIVRAAVAGAAADATVQVLMVGA